MESREEVLTIDSPFGKDLTCVEVIVQKTRAKTVINTSPPVNVISSKLMQRLKLAPDLSFDQVYGTTGTAFARDVGA